MSNQGLQVIQSINQSIIVFCPRVHCKLSIFHSTVFSAFLFVSSYSPFIIMFSIIWYLLLPRNLFPCTIPSRAGVFNLLSSRANLHLSYNPAGRSHCKIQNHHGYIKHHHGGMDGSSGDPSAALRTSQLILQPFRCFTYAIGTSPTSQLILHPFHSFTYVTGHSTTLPLLHLRRRHFT